MSAVRLAVSRRPRRPLLGLSAIGLAVAVIGCGGLNNQDTTSGGLTAGGSNGYGFNSPSGGPVGGKSAAKGEESLRQLAGYVFVKESEETVGDDVIVRDTDEDVPGYVRAKGGTAYLGIADLPGEAPSHQEKVSLDGNLLHTALSAAKSATVTVSGTITTGKDGQELLKASSPLPLAKDGPTLLNLGTPAAKKSTEPGTATSYRVAIDGTPLGDKPLLLVAPTQDSDPSEDRLIGFLGIDAEKRAGARLEVTAPEGAQFRIQREANGTFRIHPKPAKPGTKTGPVALEFKVSAGGDKTLPPYKVAAQYVIPPKAEFLGKALRVEWPTSGADPQKQGNRVELTLKVTDSGKPVTGRAVTFSIDGISGNAWANPDKDPIFIGGTEETPNVVNTNADGIARISLRTPHGQDGRIETPIGKVRVIAALEGGGHAFTIVDVYRK